MRYVFSVKTKLNHCTGTDHCDSYSTLLKHGGIRFPCLVSTNWASFCSVMNRETSHMALYPL